MNSVPILFSRDSKYHGRIRLGIRIVLVALSYFLDFLISIINIYKIGVVYVKIGLLIFEMLPILIDYRIL